MKSSAFALLLLGACALSASAQQVYTWTDANGVKHFSDSPPPKNTVDAKKLNVRGGVSSTEVESADAEAGADSAGPKMAAAAGYSAEDIKRNCEIARGNMNALNASVPAADASPEAQVDHQERVGKAQQQLNLFCGGA